MREHNDYTEKGVDAMVFKMRHISGGQFKMGDVNDGPVHDVGVSSFYMGIYPVTQALWKAVMGGENPAHFAGDKRPVERVSWLDINHKFLPKLNEQTQLSRPSGLVYRLPTEAEWEYAARGGQHQSDYTYSGSDKLKEVGWFRENSHMESKDVGLKKPNALGLYDMSGNVWEWCRDWYGSNYYQKCREQGLSVNPTGPADGRFRVSRGGSWFYFAQYCRVAFRDYWQPGNRFNHVGFRLVLAPRISGSAASGGHGAD